MSRTKVFFSSFWGNWVKEGSIILFSRKVKIKTNKVKRWIITIAIFPTMRSIKEERLFGGMLRIKDKVNSRNIRFKFQSMIVLQQRNM